MKFSSLRHWGVSSLAAALVIAGWGCGPKGSSTGEPTSGGTGTASLSGSIIIDGSSTVFPISQAAAEEFMKANKGVNVAVAESGTGGGMKKFTAGEIDICDASRSIDEKEIALCKEKGIEFVEIPVAFDGLAVVVNPKNSFAETLTVEELKKLWEPDSKIETWSEIRPGFPNTPIKLFGPGSDSGTYEYFTEAIVKQKNKSRQDYTASEDDNVLVQGVAGEEGALGYFGLAYYSENSDKLKLVKIDDGTGPVAPTTETVNNGTYKPLSRPLFIYVKKSALERPEVAAFVEYYLSQEGRALVEQVGYVKLPEEAYAKGLERAKNKTTGSLFSGQNTVGLKIEDVLARESK